MVQQHDAFYALESVPDPLADHIRGDKTTIDRLEQISFYVVAITLYGTRISSRYFIDSVTRMISECAVLLEEDSGDDRPSGEGYDPKRFALKIGEADDPGCEDSDQPGGDHHDSFNDTGDSDVIAWCIRSGGVFAYLPGARSEGLVRVNASLSRLCLKPAVYAEPMTREYYGPAACRPGEGP